MPGPETLKWVLARYLDLAATTAMIVIITGIVLRLVIWAGRGVLRTWRKQDKDLPESLDCGCEVTRWSGCSSSHGAVTVPAGAKTGPYGVPKIPARQPDYRS